MPYLLLVIGLIIGIYALYRFFINADVEQIKALFLAVLCLAAGIALFYLSITGRFAAALGMIVAAVPIGIGYLREKANQKTYRQAAKNHSGPMTEEDALKILGLKPGASEDDIRKNYKRLMQKVHPDNEGSDWLAAKLNEAKDYLLKHKD